MLRGKFVTVTFNTEMHCLPLLGCYGEIPKSDLASKLSRAHFSIHEMQKNMKGTEVSPHETQNKFKNEAAKTETTPLTPAPDTASQVKPVLVTI